MCFLNKYFIYKYPRFIGLRVLFLMIFGIGTLFVACSDDPGDSIDQSPNSVGDTWNIPKEEVFDGGAGKDGIPSIDRPKFLSADLINYLDKTDLVLIHSDGNLTHIYPHKILDHHEALYDTNFEDQTIITYCPLTGTGIGFNGTINGFETSFGVSGLIYKNNQVLFDRLTESYWSQILRKSVYGELKGLTAKTLTLVETTWETAQKIAPKALVLSKDTGFSRVYEEFPYLDYKTNDDFFLFPVKNTDDRLPSKERVYSILGNNDILTYRFDLFEEQISVIMNSFEGVPLLIVGSKKDQFIVSFIREPDMVYESVNNEYPVIFKDNLGTKYDIFGKAISGPNIDKQMKQPDAMMGYWFSIADFYGRPQIYTR